MNQQMNSLVQPTKLIILRGNSASGKSTVASRIRSAFNRGEVMIVPQDDIRLGILHVKDRVENPTADLIKTIALFGKDKAKIIVIEGILGTHIYKKMFLDLLLSFKENAHVYYFDIPFEETVRRHQTRPKAGQWGAERMKKWWLEKDYLNVPNEKIIHSDLTEEEIVEMILTDVFEQTNENAK